jgi:hypothetical protein
MFAGRTGSRVRGAAPRRSGDEARYTPECETQNILGRARRRQLNTDHRLHLDDAGGELDEPQAQSVELAPHRTPGRRCAQAPHDPIGAGVQEQPKLIGRGLCAGRAIRRQMRLPGFDVIFGLTAPAVAILVERARIAAVEIGDDEARVGPSTSASTRAMMRSTRLQLAAPSRNSLKRRTLPSFGAASKLAFALASRSSICRRKVGVGATPKMKSRPFARHQSRTSGQQ